MKKYLKDWNTKRLSYLIGGLVFIAIGIFDAQAWWMAIFGLYFIIMSVFKLGCASGSCQIDINPAKTKKE